MAGRFETTNWSVVVRASASNTEVRQRALAELCEAYWYPLYSFARSRGHDHDDASDLTQAFFAQLLEKHGFEGLTPSQGRFRAFLLASFKNFQSDARQRAQAQKRGGDLLRIPWDEESLQARYAATLVAGGDAEQLFARQWALTVIDRARLRLRADTSMPAKATISRCCCLTWLLTKGSAPQRNWSGHSPPRKGQHESPSIGSGVDSVQPYAPRSVPQSRSWTRSSRNCGFSSRC